VDNTLVKKNWLEIGLSTGLVFLMIVIILGAQIALPAELRSSSFALIVMLFMVAMGLVGLKIVDM
jgi:fucose permease